MPIWMHIKKHNKNLINILVIYFMLYATTTLWERRRVSPWAWYVSNVSINFYAPCLFMHHLLCVLLHFVAFYAFSRAKLLTRCHSASSLFSVVFVFQKSYTGNILGIGRNKAEVPIFPGTRLSPKQRQRGSRGQPHHRVARPAPGPCH
jgi:hypothetical protein